jgi:hypothetical protein
MLSLAVLWERHVFVGLLDFDDVFRVTGTFASMNTGGAYIEAYIAFAFPALAVWTLQQGRWPLRLLGMALAAIAVYAMVVTYSRGGYAGLVAGLLVVVVAFFRWRLGSRRTAWAVLGGLAAVTAAIALPVLTSGFAEQRLARSAQDLSTRLAHWERALSLMDPGLVPAVFGMGFGQYPSLYLMAAAGERPPGTYSLMDEGENRFLRLGAGETVFLDQLVDVEPEAVYELTARVRAPYGSGSLRVPLCEKALLYSFACEWPTLTPDRLSGDWVELSAQVQTGHLAQTGRWPRPPVKLSLHNGGGGSVDVDDVSLRAPHGRELIANGDFSDGVKRWLFVTDQDLGWHIHEQWVEIYFGQGLLGLVGMLALLAGVGAGVRHTPSADLWEIAILGGLTGLLAVGLLGSTADSPRIWLLLCFGLWCYATLAAGGRRSLSDKARVRRSERRTPAPYRRTVALTSFLRH